MEGLSQLPCRQPLASQTLFTLHAPTYYCGFHTTRDLKASGDILLLLPHSFKFFFKKETICIHNQGKKEDILACYHKSHPDPFLFVL